MKYFRECTPHSNMSEEISSYIVLANKRTFEPGWIKTLDTLQTKYEIYIRQHKIRKPTILIDIGQNHKLWAYNYRKRLFYCITGDTVQCEISTKPFLEVQKKQNVRENTIRR